VSGLEATWFTTDGGDEERVQFVSLSPGVVISRAFRDLRSRTLPGGDEEVTCTKGGRTLTGVSDTYEGALLNLVARDLGLGGEIRGKADGA
jgi:hypothetical protein